MTETALALSILAGLYFYGRLLIAMDRINTLENHCEFMDRLARDLHSIVVNRGQYIERLEQERDSEGEEWKRG